MSVDLTNTLTPGMDAARFWSACYNNNNNMIIRVISYTCTDAAAAGKVLRRNGVYDVYACTETHQRQYSTKLDVLSKIKFQNGNNNMFILLALWIACVDDVICIIIYRFRSKSLQNKRRADNFSWNYFGNNSLKTWQNVVTRVSPSGNIRVYVYIRPMSIHVHKL